MLQLQAMYSCSTVSAELKLCRPEGHLCMEPGVQIYGDISTWLVWNFLIAVAICGSLSNELDPVLHLGNPGIHTVAGAFCTKTHHTNGRESTERNEGSCPCVLHSTYLPFSETISGPPESPWHESLLPSPAQMWKLNMLIFVFAFTAENYLATF